MLKNLSLVLFTFWLTACSSTPTHVILAPQIGQQKTVYQSQVAQISVTDNRVGQQLVQVLKTGEAATLYQPLERLDQIIQTKLSTGWQQQGLVLSDNASTTLSVFIDEAIVSVQQQRFEYQSNQQIKLRLLVNTASNDQSGRLEKAFTVNGIGSGKFNVDLAVLERDFNDILATALQNILADSEVQQFIKEA